MGGLKYVVRTSGREYRVEIDGEPPHFHLVIDDRPFEVDATALGDESLVAMLVDNRSILAYTRVADSRRGWLDVSIGGKYRRLEVHNELTSAMQRSGDSQVRGRVVLEAPMPGLVVALRVKVGDTVAVGTPLVVMEAMKMQNELLCETAGIVREVRVSVQQAVESGAELVIIDAG